MNKTGKDLSIVLSGEAGQGIQTLERLLMSMFKHAGWHVFSYSEFMSRIRGGNNSTEIRVSAGKAGAFIDRIDIFIPFNSDSMARFHERITGKTVIIGDPGFIEDRYREGDYTIHEIPLSSIAQEIGGKIYINLIIMGIFAGLYGIDDDIAATRVRSHFSRSPEEIISKNINALMKGVEAGGELARSGKVSLSPDNTPDAVDEVLLTGAESITLGGIAGGCNFVSSYPMSPSTDVLVNFAKYSGDFGIVVEQAEDEICAINMAIASWYAGGRAMVTTSGGGFALMTEGVSLAGAIESPVVIHLGQRPGPATGLPTRTEQGDLMFALFSGHGEFPRVLYAPGNHAQGFELTRRAFYTADKYQVPVIILTDQYYLDSISSLPEMKIDDSMCGSTIVQTDGSYKRHALTANGISPRGIPGFGDGIVCVDSDEHDEGGYITESCTVRTDQMNKRMRKLQSMGNDSLPPELYGPDDYRRLIVSWGSTLNCVLEAIDAAGLTDTALLHFSQLYPVHPDTEGYLKRAKVSMIVENNHQSQFGKLLRMETGFTFNHTILKYNGMPFSVEELAEAFKKPGKGTP